MNETLGRPTKSTRSAALRFLGTTLGFVTIVVGAGALFGLFDRQDEATTLPNAIEEHVATEDAPRGPDVSVTVATTGRVPDGGRIGSDANLEVTVIDEASHPLASIALSLIRLSGSTHAERIDAQTDAQGRARFTPRHGQHLLRINHAGNDGATVRPSKEQAAYGLTWPPPVSSDPTLVVELGRTNAGLDVVVIDASDRFVDGASILVRRAGEAMEQRSGDPAHAEAIGARPFSASTTCTRVASERYRILDPVSCTSCHVRPKRGEPIDEPPEDDLFVTHRSTMTPIARPLDTIAVGLTDQRGLASFGKLRPGDATVEVVWHDDEVGRPRAFAETKQIRLEPGVTKRAVLRVVAPIPLRATVDGCDLNTTLVFEPCLPDQATTRRYMDWTGLDEAAARSIFATQSPRSVTVRMGEQMGDGSGTSTVLCDFGEVVLRPGPWFVHVALDPRSDACPANVTRLDLGPDRPTTWHASIQTSPHAMRGRIVDAESSRPLFGVRVVARTMDGFLLKCTETATDGSYTIRGLPAGPLRICVHRTWQRRVLPRVHRTDFDAACTQYAGPTSGVTQVLH
ncbi:MAG: carboxypeptidase regulatory-like domain-containing protein [Planctomycetes bacterium]|nr:carboxypeptidase regulatory-like domain-containing protein [Planctomycetota bacterium]